MDYQIQLAEQRQVPYIAHIARLASRYPWSEAVIADCFRAGYSTWVALVEGVVRGFAVMSTSPFEAELLNICVDPSVQRCGIGRALLQRVLADAQEQQLERVLLEVRASNDRAITLYTDMGFQPIGVRRRYYPLADGQREDALLFFLGFADISDSKGE